MRKIREVARLHFLFGRSGREISRSVRIGRTTVQEMLQRIKEAGLTWPILDTLTDTELEERLYPSTHQAFRKDEPDWSMIHRELRRRGVTLRLL